MRNILLNPLLQEVRGRIGPLVFRRFRGKTVVQRAPDMTRVVASPAQLAQRARFQRAVAHARAVLADPVLRARQASRAQSRGLTVFALCIADYLKAPEGRPAALERPATTRAAGVGAAWGPLPGGGLWLTVAGMKTMPPLVLISGSTDDRGAEFEDYSLSLSMNYPLAVRAGGGQPWLLPCLPDRAFVAGAVRRCDGVLLTGGDDVDPRRYARRLPPAVAATVHRAHAARDAFETLLVEESRRQGKPLLGICRGHQILNVALGGTLTADIQLQLPACMNHNRAKEKDRVVHTVTCAPGSLLRRMAGGNRLWVNSSHHQAVARVAKVLRVTAVSRDGIVEGLELAPEARGLWPWLLAVQFHPERLFRRHAGHLELFRNFVRACARSRLSVT
ncbi:MAG: hypothetical protein RJA22_2838 [Verrucomicrobiota bacterium]|jgi:putative glutamine amidotransferase